MLFSVYLAEKLGNKGLSAFSLHPGAIMTNLGRHLTSNDVVQELCKFPLFTLFGIFNMMGLEKKNESHANANRCLEIIVALDRELGNKEGQLTDFPLISLEEGTSTHVYAAFDPEIVKVNGEYLQDAQVAPEEDVKPYAVDKEEAEKLWKVSEEIVGEEFVI